MPLNFKQGRFVEEYVLDGNATQAALRAGYAEKAAGQQGHSLLKKVEIQKAILERREKRIATIEVTEAWVLERMAFVVAECSTMGPRWSPSGAARAAEVIGKFKHSFSNTIEIGGKVDVEASGEFRLVMQPGDDKL